MPVCLCVSVFLFILGILGIYCNIENESVLRKLKSVVYNFYPLSSYIFPLTLFTLSPSFIPVIQISQVDAVLHVYNSLFICSFFSHLCFSLYYFYWPVITFANTLFCCFQFVVKPGKENPFLFFSEINYRILETNSKTLFLHLFISVLKSSIFLPYFSLNTLKCIK